MELILEFLNAPYESGGLVLEWPSGVPPRAATFLPVLRRHGGVLAAVPFEFSRRELVVSRAGRRRGCLVVGPSQQASVGPAEEEEEEDGSIVPTGVSLFRAFPVPTASPGLPSNPLGSLTGLLGPPPKTRAPVLHPTQPVQSAMLQQAVP